MPAECPDLKDHNSFFSENMTPELYNKLKDKKTKLGVNLGTCIKTGVDNKGKFRLKLSKLTFALRSPHDQNLRYRRW